MSQETKIILGIAVVSIVIVVAAVLILGGSSPSTTSSTPVDPKILVKNDSQKIASSSAKVTLVEFADYQCPACLGAQPMVDQILKEDAGKINYVFRNFPLPQHANAQEAAEAALSAGAQGKYWPMHDKLYQTQPEWASLKDPTDYYVNLASQLGLDTNIFKQDLTANKYQSVISEDQQDGYTLGVDSTPTFFVDNIKLDPSVDLKTKIDSELAKNP